MNILGIAVKHQIWGIGEVISFDGKYLSVEFSVGVKRFVFPDAFEKFIKAEDLEIQSSVENEIKIIKETELQRKRQERKCVDDVESIYRNKKRRSIDEMFSADYHVENLARNPVLTYRQVEEQFGIRISGFGRGINPTEHTVILISSIAKSDGGFVYHDRWTESGDYIYSGEGKIGNQSMIKGNLAIKNAARDGKTIHLFVKFSPQEYYYQGIFALVEYTYEDEKDENGNTRKEYKFRLRKVN